MIVIYPAEKRSLLPAGRSLQEDPGHHHLHSLNNVINWYTALPIRDLINWCVKYALNRRPSYTPTNKSDAKRC